MDLLFPSMGASSTRANEAARRHLKPLQDAGQGAGPVGLPPRAAPRRAGLWPGQAGADERDHRPLALGADGVRHRRARHRQCRDPRDVRHRRAEGNAISSPLMDGEIVSCFSMTEPQAGADPGEFTCTRDAGRRRVGDRGREVVLVERQVRRVPARHGRHRSREAPLTERMSMFIVPADTPGIEILRNVAIAGDTDPENGAPRLHPLQPGARAARSHARRAAASGFKVAQARLGGGRIHHAMRTVGKCNRALEMMLERAVSRRTRGKMLGDHQMVQAQDRRFDHRAGEVPPAGAQDRLDRSTRSRRGACRTARRATTSACARWRWPKVYHDIVGRALQLHGSLGHLARPAAGQLVRRGTWRWPSPTARPRSTRSQLATRLPQEGQAGRRACSRASTFPTRTRRGAGALSRTRERDHGAMIDPLFDFTGKVALVTGGSRGLGYQMVRAFAERGADVHHRQPQARQLRDGRRGSPRAGPQGARRSRSTSASGPSSTGWSRRPMPRSGVWISL